MCSLELSRHLSTAAFSAKYKLPRPWSGGPANPIVNAIQKSSLCKDEHAPLKFLGLDVETPLSPLSPSCLRSYHRRHVCIALSTSVSLMTMECKRERGRVSYAGGVQLFCCFNLVSKLSPPPLTATNCNNKSYKAEKQQHYVVRRIALPAPHYARGAIGRYR